MEPVIYINSNFLQFVFSLSNTSDENNTENSHTVLIFL